jgi:anthranilate phosphoribosyltransferase
MNIQQALNHITKNIHLTQAQMEDVMRSIMQVKPPMHKLVP